MKKFSAILIAFIFALLSFQLKAQAPNCGTYTAPANASSGTGVNITLTWVAPVGGNALSGYRLYFGTVQDFSSGTIVNGTYLGNVLSYVASGLTCNTTYYWKVVPTRFITIFEFAATGCVTNYFNTAPALSQISLTGLLYKFSFTGNALDLSGNAYNGTLLNSPTLVADRFSTASSAYQFNGTNQQIATPLYFNNLNNFTYSLWFKTTTTTGGKLIGFGSSQSGSSIQFDRHIYMSNSGQLYFGVYPTVIKTINSTASYNDGNWHMVVASLSSTTGMALYVDGALIASDATVLTAENSSGYIRIAYDNASGWTNSPTSSYFAGTLDDILIYNRVLTASEISTAYLGPEGVNSNGPLCAGSTLNLSSTAVAGATYSWTGPNGFTSALQNPSIASVTTAAAGTYKLTSSQNSCTSSIAAVNVSITPALAANTIGSDQGICIGANAVLTQTTPTGGSGTYAYQWTSSPDNLSFSNISGVTSPSYSPGAIPATTYYQRVVVSGACTSTTASVKVTVNPIPNLSTIPLIGLIAKYNFDGDAADLSGNNNTGTLQAAPALTTDRFGLANKAYAFNGASQYITTTNQFVNPGDLSYSLWFKTNTTTGGRLIGFGDAQVTTSGSYDRHIYMNNAGQLYWGVYPNGVQTVNTTASYNDNIWHQVVASISSVNGMKLYVDGVLRGTLPGITSSQVFTGYFKIAYDNVNGWTSQPASFYFNGSLDDILIYNRELSGAEVISIYSSTSNGVSNNGPVCAGSTLNLTTATLASVAYSWTGPNSFASTAQNPSIASVTPAAAGVYSVTASANGCTSAPIYTNAVVYTLPAITTQPAAVVLCNATTAGFTVAGTGTNTTYQWQVNTGSGFANIANGGSYSGATSNALGLTGITGSFDTYQYRAIIGGTCTPSVNSNAVLLSVNTTGKWLGNTNDWNTASNWCGGIPASTTDVTISSGVPFFPQVTTPGGTCRTMIVGATSSVTVIAGNTLSVYGNFTNNGTYTDNGTSNFTGTTLQTVTGNTSFNNMTINNANGVTLSSPVTVNGILTLTNGTLASGGNLSVNLNTGLIAGSGAGVTSGNIRVFKNIPTNSWHYLCAPLPSMTAAQINDNVAITNGLYSYDETNLGQNGDIGWVQVVNTTDALIRMKGYILNLPAPALIDFSGTYTHNPGNISIACTNSISGDVTSDGYNFVGNPYPGPIDWTLVSRTNVDNAIYIWNAATNQTSSYVFGAGTNTATQYQASFQGFHVHVNTAGGSGSITMNNSVRVTTPNNAVLRKAAEENLIRLKIESLGYSDETLLRILPEATPSFDTEFDAYKVIDGGLNPSIFSRLGSTQYSINSLDAIFRQTTIPLRTAVGFAGNYTISLAGNIEGKEVWLQDRKLNINQNLSIQPDYIAELTETDTSERFFLTFGEPVITANESKGERFSLACDQENNLKIQIENLVPSGAAVSISNVIGVEILRKEDVKFNSGEYTLSLANLKSGVYLISVQNGGAVHNGKIWVR